jgi:hypothetical protein
MAFCQTAGSLQSPIIVSRPIPLVVLLEQNCPNEADDRRLVGEDAGDIGAALDRAIEALEWVRRADLAAVAFVKGRGGERDALAQAIGVRRVEPLREVRRPATAFHSA